MAEALRTCTGPGGRRTGDCIGTDAGGPGVGRVAAAGFWFVTSGDGGAAQSDVGLKT